MSNATTHIETKKRSAERSRSKLVPELRFKEFEGEWDKPKLSERMEIFRGASPRPKGDPRYYGGDIPRLMIQDVTRDGKYAYPCIDFLTEEGAKKSRLLKKGSIVLSCSGTRVAIPGILGIDACIHDGWLAFRNYKNIETDFLYNLFVKLHERMQGSATTGGVFNNLTTSIVRDLRMGFPTLPEQQKIASFLSAVDEKIQQLTKKKALLEQYKKGLMQQLFSCQLRFKDENGNPYPDWEEKRLGEVFGVIRGKGISKDQLNDNGETKCILYGQLYTTYNEVVFNVVSRTDTNEGVLSIKGDLLVPSSTTTTGIDLANVTALNEEGVLLGGDISILRSKLDANNVFYAYYLSNHKKYEIAAFAQGSTIVHLSYNHFKVMRIDIPVIEEQQKIATYLSRIDTKIEAVNNQITQTQTFKKGLLQQMFV